VVTVTLPTDHFPPDDTASLAIDVLESLRVLIVDGEPGPGAEGESWYLTHALSPDGPIASGLEVEVATAGRFAGLDLEPYAAVILANVYRLEPARVEALVRYVQAGGGLLIFPGDQTDPDLFARELVGRLAPAALGPRWGDPDAGALAAFAPPPGEHPVTALFRGADNPFLAPTKLHHWYELEPVPGARVLLRTRSAGLGIPVEGVGQPILVEQTVGDGRVLQFGIPADDEWSGWVAEPSFLVTMQEALRHVASRRRAGRNVPVGTRVVRPLDPARFEVEAELISPVRPGEPPSARRTTLVASQVGEHPLALDLGVLQRAGVHELRLRGRNGGVVIEHHVAFAPPEEGDLRHADEATLRALLEDVEFRYVTSLQELALQDETTDRGELWRAIAVALLVLLLAESLMAWRFGHHGGAP
jgi:hypothetical protein